MVRKPNIAITRGKLLGAVRGSLGQSGAVLTLYVTLGQLSPGAVVAWADVAWAVVAWAVVVASRK